MKLGPTWSNPEVGCIWIRGGGFHERALDRLGPFPRLLLCLPMIMHFDTTFGGIASQRCSAAVATTVITSVTLGGIWRMEKYGKATSSVIPFDPGLHMGLAL